MRHFARKAAGMRRKIDEADGSAITAWHMDIPTKIFFERISEFNAAIDRHGSQNFACKGLCHRTNTKRRSAVWHDTGAVLRLTETCNDPLATPHGADKKGGDLVLVKKNGAREFNRLAQAAVLCARGGPGQ